MDSGNFRLGLFKVGMLILLGSIFSNVWADNIIQQNEPINAYGALDTTSILFNFPYLGVGLNFAGSAHKGSYNNLTYDNSYYSGENSVGGSVFLGIGKLFRQYYLGAELFYQYSPFAILDHDITDGLTNTHLELINVKSNYSYGANIRLGGMTSPGTLFYGLFGVDLSNFKTQMKYYYPTKTDVNSFNKSVMGIMPGVGIEVALPRGFSLREQYALSFYENISNTRGGYLPTERVSLNDLMNGVFSLAVIYHLPIYSLSADNPLPLQITADSVLFNHPYVGFGLNSGALENKGQLNFQEDDLNWKFMARKNSFGGNILFGYGQNLVGHIYAGVEVFADYMPFNVDDAMIKANGESYTHQLNSNYSAGGDLRLGYLITPATLGYLVFGMDMTQFNIKEKYSADLADIIKFDVTKPGYLGGVGVETALGSGWALRAQYIAAYYSTINKSGVIAGENTTFKFKNIVKNAFTIGLDYYLG